MTTPDPAMYQGGASRGAIGQPGEQAPAAPSFPQQTTYDIANIGAPANSAVTAAPSYSALQNAQSAAVANQQLGTFYGTGSGSVPEYSVPPVTQASVQAASGSVT